ncbi:Imm21 family immunity protein [Streptomyces cinereoruber]|uniref:Imm21 family immunity protein n=1 Tax=Streptomyces cinereoruber TaxID=67260 RepID=UPI003C2F469E
MTVWLESTDFARYALVSEELLPVWTGAGADGLAGEHVAVVRVAGRDVLTLGGEPLPVTWIAEELVFARSYGVEGDAALLSAVRDAAGADGWMDLFSLVLGGRHVLTDSACDGDRILDCSRDARQPVETLRVELPRRRYRVRSLVVEPDPETQLVLERLLPE